METVGHSGAGNVSTHTDSVIVHDSPIFKKRSLMSRPILWVVLLVIALLIVIGLLLTLQDRHAQHAVVSASNISEIENQGMAIAKGQGAQAALSFYETEIANASNNAVRAQLEIQAAQIALNAKDSSVALNYARKAEVFHKDTNTSAMIAAIYLQEGNKGQAARYYRLAAQEDNHATLGSTPASFYEGEAQQAEQGSAQ